VYSWTLPDTESSEFIIEVSAEEFTDMDIVDASDDMFSVLSTEEHYLTVTSPTGGGLLITGTSAAIAWEHRGIDSILIEYSTDNGATWKEIARDIPASDGSYDWTVPDDRSAESLVRISDTVVPDVHGMSAGLFEILKPAITVAHDPIVSAPANTSLTFQVSVVSEAPVESVNLYYDRTGEREFDGERVLEQQGESYQTSLNTGLFTAFGLEYYITVTDVTGYTARLPESKFYSIQAKVTAMQSDVTVAGGSEQNAYRMISAPLILTGTTITEQLLDKLPPGDSGTDWRLFRWFPMEDRYREYPDTGESFGPGKAFWIIIKSGDYTLKGLEGTTVPTDTPFEIALAPGWNDIADPWLFPIAWGDVENPMSANISVPYTYEDAGRIRDP